MEEEKEKEEYAEKKEWVLIDSETDTGQPSSTWSRLLSTAAKGFSQIELLVKKTPTASLNVRRSRALLFLLRIMYDIAELEPLAQQLEKDIAENALCKWCEAFRVYVGLNWTGEEVMKEKKENAKRLLCALQMLSESAKEDGKDEEYNSLVNTIQPLVFIAKNETLERPNDSYVKFTVKDSANNDVELKLYEDVLVRGEVVTPLDWIWIALNKEKTMVKIVTLNTMFAYQNSEDKGEVLKCLRHYVSEYLNKVEAINPQGLRRIRFRCPEYRYIGQAKAATMHGGGVLETELFNYSGMFTLGKKEGKGVMIHKEGWTYKGHWKQDVREGRGVLHFAKGQPENAFKFIGFWSGDSRNGMGVLYKNDGSSMRCCWKDNVALAPVTLHYGNGTVYSGGWNGEKVGYGITHTTEGRYYGEWIAGQRQGYGSYQSYTKPHVVLSGVWMQGKMVGKGQIDIPSVCSLQGVFNGVNEQNYTDCNLNTARFIMPDDPHTHSGRWNLFVKTRFDALSVKFGEELKTLENAVREVLKKEEGEERKEEAREKVEGMLRESTVYRSLLDEFVFISSSLFDKKVIDETGRRSSEEDYHLFCRTLFALIVSRVPGVEGWVLLAVEKMLMDQRPAYQKTVLTHCEHANDDVIIDHVCTAFVKLSREGRLDLLFDKGNKVRADLLDMTEEPLVQSAQALQKLSVVRTPHEKLDVLRDWVDCTNASLQLEGADDLIPCLIYSLAMSCVPGLMSECLFIERFMSSTDEELIKTSGTRSYMWALFQSSVRYVKELDLLNLHKPSLLVIEMADEESSLFMNNSLRISPSNPRENWDDNVFPKVESSDYMLDKLEGLESLGY